MLRARLVRASHVFMTSRLAHGTLDVDEVKNEHSHRQHGDDPNESRIGGFIHTNMLSHHTTSTLT